jgi:hypothetical protein
MQKRGMWCMIRVRLTEHDIHERRKTQMRINTLSCANSLTYTRFFLTVRRASDHPKLQKMTENSALLSYINAHL